MKKMKRVVSLAVILCMAVSMAVLFCGCDDYDSIELSGDKLPKKYIGTYWSCSDNQSIKIVANDGDGIYRKCPKLYANNIKYCFSYDKKGNKKYAYMFNDTIQTIDQKVKKNDEGNIIVYYDEYSFSAIGTFKWATYTLFSEGNEEYLRVFFTVKTGGNYYGVDETFVKR